METKILKEAVEFGWAKNGLRMHLVAPPQCQDSCQCVLKVDLLDEVLPCCICDEGRPLGFADQAVIPNYPGLHT